MTEDKIDIIILHLRVLQDLRNSQGEIWRARAYSNVVKELGLLKASGKTVKKVEDVRHVKGVGVKIRFRINDILKKGYTDETKQYVELMELMRVPNIGLATAKQLYAKGIRSLSQLKRHPKLLNKQQLIGIRYMDDLKHRIPREEMDKHAKLLTKLLQPLEVYVLGSYRRGAPSSGDIDVVVVEDKDTKSKTAAIEYVLTRLSSSKYLKTTVNNGDRYATGIVKVADRYRHLDVVVAKKQNLPFAMLYLTGSKAFNIQMRAEAKRKGFLLNDQGLYDLKTKRRVKTTLKNEKDVFEYIGLPFVRPENR